MIIVRSEGKHKSSGEQWLSFI